MSCNALCLNHNVTNHSARLISSGSPGTNNIYNLSNDIACNNIVTDMSNSNPNVNVCCKKLSGECNHESKHPGIIVCDSCIDIDIHEKYVFKSVGAPGP